MEPRAGLNTLPISTLCPLHSRKPSPRKANEHTEVHARAFPPEFPTSDVDKTWHDGVQGQLKPSSFLQFLQQSSHDSRVRFRIWSDVGSARGVWWAGVYVGDRAGVLGRASCSASSHVQDVL